MEDVKEAEEVKEVEEAGELQEEQDRNLQEVHVSFILVDF